MGKRKAGLSGLSRFVKEAFGESPADTQTPPKTTTPSNRDSSTHAPEQNEADIDSRPTKKQKIGLLGPGYERYDATSLVPHYTKAKQVPSHLQKYFSQRKRYFSLYDEGCLLDEVGWYSVTPERVADQIAERCRCDTILDAFCGVGGNAIAFARTCERVIALDTSPLRLALARHNAIIYGVEDRIEFILADYLSFATAYLSSPSSQRRKIDVIFLSPPWGGPSYLTGSNAPPATEDQDPQSDGDTTLIPMEAHPEYSLSSIEPVHGVELFGLSRRITNNIAYFLPRNTSLEEISQLVRGSNSKGMETEEMVEVEEEWMSTKLKALTCYFGGLVDSQESLY